MLGFSVPLYCLITAQTNGRSDVVEISYTSARRWSQTTTPSLSLPPPPTQPLPTWEFKTPLKQGLFKKKFANAIVR